MSRTLDTLAHRFRVDRLAFRIWRYGPLGLLRLYRHHAFDRDLGVNTRGYGDPRYEPTPGEVFHEIMSLLPLDPRDFVFVDYGSGKGKVLMLAAHYPFHGVMGVELWEDLHLVAVENLRRFENHPARVAKPVALLLDARELPLPEKPLVLYFFNPFPEDIIRGVLANLKLSLSRAPRRVYVLFYAPVRRGTPWDRRSVFEEAGFLEVYRDDPRFTVYTAT